MQALRGEDGAQRGLARLCRWRAAGARKKTLRQMRDAARRSGTPRPRCVPAPLCRLLPAARYISQNTSIIAWCVSPLRAGRGAGRARRGPGASRSEAGGRLASPCALFVHYCNAALENSRQGARVLNGLL
ncbi:unnamed protein product [Arctia plantaginis]|uniref:Uncharacterized protein n=1 Tax=Arctia plantaginis TaxID=874455 RepID=A0A8S1ARR6_ARCPL|nr:unnamed protein product [Arctia plantaginis]